MAKRKAGRPTLAAFRFALLQFREAKEELQKQEMQAERAMPKLPVRLRHKGL